MVWFKMGLKERYRKWQHQRYLKKHNLTQRQYDLIHDPDYNACGNRVRRDIFHGYPHVFPYPPTGMKDYGFHGVSWHVEHVEEMMAWCDTNCRGKWRNNWHRVLRDVWYDDEWDVNEIGGGDIMFFGFKDSKDAMMFALRWS